MIEIYIVTTDEDIWAFKNRHVAMKKWKSLVRGRIAVVKVDESEQP